MNKRLPPGVLIAFFAFSLAAAPQPPLKLDGPKPLSPRDEQATFRLPADLRMDLAAAEPDVVDPVAMAFDEDGRLFVAEMRAYPNEGIGTGAISSGRIRLLEDRDADGFYEKSTVFADKLRLPTSVMPYKGGVLVADPPEIAFLRDTDGDGKADERRTLYTGFGLANIQQMINSLQWGLDNWVHGAAGSNGGTVQSTQVAKPALELRGRGVRFRPDVPGSLQATSGGGQFGIAADDWGQWFTATNSQHLRHIVLPDHYLQRNPFLAVAAVSTNIPDHGAACKVHRISPFESWRVERTRRRKESEAAKNFSPTELVPGGYSTSTCGTLVYRGDALPKNYYGQVFVCDPANNLIHRDALVPSGATFIGKRVDDNCELLASTDNWFRPVNLTLGPDGCIYVCDFYREAIETPLSLPDDIKKALNLHSRERGRIWRIRPAHGTLRGRPGLGKASSAELVTHLSDANAWWRMTAQRLLVERQDKTVVPELVKLAEASASPLGRLHALCALDGLGSLSESLIIQALHDRSDGVRENALRLADSKLSTSASLREAVPALADDAAARVRFQLALTLGEADGPGMAAALAKIASHPDTDSWTQTAVLSSVRKTAPQLLALLHAKRQATPLLQRLAEIAGASAENADLAAVFALLHSSNANDDRDIAILEGLGAGLRNGGKALAKLWDEPPAALRNALDAARPFFVRAAATASNDKETLAQRVAAARLLSYGPFTIAKEPLITLIHPQQPHELQLAGLRALSAHDHADVPELLFASWISYSPNMRREVIESLFARSDRLHKLLDAIAAKQVLASQLGPTRLQQLRNHANAAIRQRAQKLLAQTAEPGRQTVIDHYQQALKLDGDATRGKKLFAKTCAVCHRLENVGVEVGADLRAVLGTKKPAALLIDILDPSREVDPRYIDYLVTTQAGQVASGMIAAETASSVTLRRAEKVEDTILRTQIDTIQATARSLMPEGLEMQLATQDVADVIAYLLGPGRR